MGEEKTLIIIPTVNEVDNIVPLVKQISFHCGKVQLLFIDDGSKDGTVNEIERQRNKTPLDIHLLKRERKMGLGSAYRLGFDWALERGFDYIIQMDADLSHNPIYLPTMLDMLSCSDVVVGSRYIFGGGIKNWGFIRRLISRFGSLYASFILGMNINDVTGGFNAWSAQALRRLDTQKMVSEGYSFQIEMKHRACSKRLKITELPILFNDRKSGRSKMSLSIIIEAILIVWRFRFFPYKPGKILKLLG